VFYSGKMPGWFFKGVGAPKAGYKSASQHQIIPDATTSPTDVFGKQYPGVALRRAFFEFFLGGMTSTALIGGLTGLFYA